MLGAVPVFGHINHTATPTMEKATLQGTTMQRRHFHLLTLSAAFINLAHARRPVPAVTSIDAQARIKALRITTGPLTNGYMVAPNGRLNWYFTNLGLLPIVQYLNAADLDTYIRKYMDLYLSFLESNYAIQDVDFTDSSLQTFTRVPSDSDNSYAATIASLAARYLKATNNWTWWDANKAKLKNIVYANIATVQKTNGLCRVFQLPRVSAVSNFGYLMNNAEDYRGLRDFASILSLRGETTEANYYNNVATTIAQSMQIYLWDSARSGFRTSDQDARADTSTFYPGTTCQIFPQAFGVSELSTYFTPAYQFLNRYSPQWSSEIYDPYPWAILGYVAAKRGDTTRAIAQQAASEAKFAANPALLTINELGFYQRTKSLLNGFGDI
jgi:hypothetical protein